MRSRAARRLQSKSDRATFTNADVGSATEHRGPSADRESVTELRPTPLINNRRGRVGAESRRYLGISCDPGSGGPADARVSRVCEAGRDGWGNHYRLGAKLGDGTQDAARKPCARRATNLTRSVEVGNSSLGAVVRPSILGWPLGKRRRLVYDVLRTA